MKKQKLAQGNVHIVIILSFIAVVSMVGIAFYNNYTKTNYEVYKVGDVVEVKLNNKDDKPFNVISDDGESLTLLYSGILSNGKYNDVSECVATVITGCPGSTAFKDSTIERTLEALKKNWTNINSIRLISMDEVKNLAKIDTRMETAIISGSPSEFSQEYISGPSWILTMEPYWTSTVNDDNLGHIDIVSSDGAIGMVNRVSEDRGIRPVVVISKKYIK